MIINWNNICKDFEVTITWNSFVYDTSKSIKEHIDELMLSEDLLQIILNERENIIFDAGWPDIFNHNASFIIYN